MASESQGTATEPRRASQTEPATRQGDGTPDLTGWTLEGRYEIEGTLGRGGMGAVYRARQLALDRPVAIKIIKPEYARREMYLERFLREAKVSSKIQHPNVVQIMDFGQLPGGSVYFVMELLEGETLGQLLRRRRMVPWIEAREILRQVIQGLGAAHRRGVVHRDVKPGNVFLVHSADPGFRVKVLDFGIAKVVQQSKEDELTSTNEVLGTAAYMAPEQAFARPVDARTDVYGLGVVAYKMLTGTLPFKGSSAFETVAKQVNEPPQSMRAVCPEIPREVEATIFKALAKGPEDRFQSMEEFEAAILQVWDSQPGSSASVPDVMPVASGSASQSAIENDTEIEQTTLSSQTSTQRSSLWAVAAVIAVGCVAGAAIWTSVRGGDVDRSERAAEPTAPAVVSSISTKSSPPANLDEPSQPRVAAAPTEDGAAADAPAVPATAQPEIEPRPEPEPEPEPELEPRPRTKPKAKRGAKGRAKDEAPAVTDASVERALAAKIRSRCGSKANGTRLEIRFSILSSGKPSVSRAQPPHRSSPLGKCAVEVVDAAVFSAGSLRAGKIRIDF